MTGDEVQKWRRDRLQALVDKFGGKAELGRKLGYKDGAFVGQMLTQLRPISEKTVQQVERLPGCRGWFSQEPAGGPAYYEVLSNEDRDLLRNFNELLDEDRARFFAQIAERAEVARREKAKWAERLGIPLTAPKFASERGRAAARTSVAPRQGSLDLPDPTKKAP
jgi:glucuronate isomerase